MGWRHQHAGRGRGSLAIRRLVLVDPVADERVDALLRQAVLERSRRSATPSPRFRARFASPDPELHSRYSRAVYPAWFADSEMASHFMPPEATSVTVQQCSLASVATVTTGRKTLAFLRQRSSSTAT